MTKKLIFTLCENQRRATVYAVQFDEYKHTLQEAIAIAEYNARAQFDQDKKALSYTRTRSVIMTEDHWHHIKPYTQDMRDLFN